MNWNKYEKGVFLNVVLGIVYDFKARKILIGRRENDPNIEELSWVFPGGHPEYDKELEHSVAEKVKEHTGLDIKVKKVVFAKTYPENRKILSVYYYCECEVTGGEEKAQGDLKELKWVKPSKAQNYFTTSLHPKLLEYLKTLD